MTLGPIPWLYAPEIVEPSVMPVSTMINFGLAAIISFVFPILVDVLGGPGWIFCALASLMVASYLINRKVMV